MCRLEHAEFAALMEQHQKLVYTVCYRFVHNPDVAQDLTQDTFVSAYNSIDKCEPAYRTQWLVRVASNKCKDHLRSGWVRKVETPGDDVLPEPSAALSPQPPGPEEKYIQNEGAGELETMVRSLREPYGRAATMYLLEHCTVQQIAQALQRPEKTVQNQLFRAKALLRAQITERRQA